MHMAQIKFSKISVNRTTTKIWPVKYNEAPQLLPLITAAVVYLKVVILVNSLYGGISIVHGVWGWNV